MANKKPSLLESGLKLGGIATLSTVLSGCLVTTGGGYHHGGGVYNGGGNNGSYNTGWSNPRGGHGPVICGKFRFKNGGSSFTQFKNTCAREGSYIFRIKNGHESTLGNGKCVKNCDRDGRGDRNKRTNRDYRSDASDFTDLKDTQIAAVKGAETANDNGAIFNNISAELEIKEGSTEYALKSVNGAPVSEENSRSVNTLDAG